MLSPGVGGRADPGEFDIFMEAIPRHLLNVNFRPWGNFFYRAFSHDVTAAMLVYRNKGTAAILVYQANPLGIELYFYANTFFSLAAGHVSENALSESGLNMSNPYPGEGPLSQLPVSITRLQRAH